jgi:cold shock CspA family protein
MSSEYLYGQFQLLSRKQSPRVTPPIEERAVPASGRIVALAVGHGNGVIRLGDGGKVFFHRSDLQPGTSINDFEPGDVVDFALVQDPVSGARALRVRSRVAPLGKRHEATR